MAIWEDPNILSGTSVQPVTGQPAVKPELGVYIIHQDFVTMEWALRFKMLELPPFAYACNKNQPYDTAREACVRDLLKNESIKYIFSLDSIPNYTPILIRDPITYNMDIKPISELGIFNGNGLERVNPIYPYEVFENDRWCPIKKVIRHPFKGNLKKITCRGGTIDITPNHSIYKYGQGKATSLVDVKELKIGNHLTMPRIGDWERRDNGNNLFFAGDTELAWLYGFMVAEGSVSSRKIDISLSNNNEDLLEKAKEIFETNYNVKMTLLTNRNYTSKIEITNKKLGYYLHDLLYTDNRDKRIPSSILNAPEKIINSFLEGFLEGDGHRDEHGHKSYANNSQTVIQGIMFLLRRLGYTYAVYTRPDKPNAIGLSENVRKEDWYKERLKLREKAFKLRDEKGWGSTKISRQLGISIPTIDGWIFKGNKPKRNTEPKEIKNISEKYYEGYLYDLATQTNKFSAGVGSFLVHNTDVLAPNNVVPILIQISEQFNLPVISGLYWAKKREPEPMPAAWLKTAEKPEENRIEFMPVDVKPHIEKRDTIPVDVVGAGCLLVKAEVFRKLDESKPDWPFFCWGLGRQKLQLPGGKPPPQLSEDFFFCMRCIKELDIHPHVATAIQCDHMCLGFKRGSDGKFELGRM